MTHNPDYLIHLGDVYYTGSPEFSEHPFLWGTDNEVNNLVDHWPSQQPSGTSFTLNSNHEMYCGGLGYFNDALGSEIFKHQNGTSYFLLQNDNWQIYGLDSAYPSTAALYMEGALNEDQISFIQTTRDTSKKVIFLSHHNAIDVTGKHIVMTGNTSLWDQACSALNGKAPDYWYWGHIHDGVIYAPQTRNGVSTRLRCIGHAGMPYGAPWGLTKADSQPPFTSPDYIEGIEFFAGTPVDISSPGGQVKNGFVLVTLSETGLTDEMFDSDGVKTWPL